MSSTHTLPLNIFNLKEGETKLTRDNENFSNSGENRTCDPPVQCLERPIFIVFGGSRVWFPPGVLTFPLSRVSMVSPSFKLKMFTGSVCVLLTSVSEIKIKLIYATTSSWQKKTKWRVKGKWRRLNLFFFLWSELIFWWSELIRVQCYFIFIFCSIRVDPVWLFYLPLSLPHGHSRIFGNKKIWKQAQTWCLPLKYIYVELLET